MRKSTFLSWILLGTFAGITVGTVTSFLLPTRYESTAVLRVVPCQIPERFVGTAKVPPIQRRLKLPVMVLLSDSSLANVILSYDLYPRERKKLPMEDVVLMVREDLRVWTQSEDSLSVIHLSFRYPDRVLTQKVVQGLTERLVEHYYKIQAAQQVMAVQFLRDMVDTAGSDWLLLKQGKGGGERSELRALDLESARKHYESMRQKLSEAEVLFALNNQKLGENLELTERASLPRKPVSPRRGAFLAGGAVLGLVAGLIVVLPKKLWSGGRPESVS